uniref:Uncharacterized protein n=1 Tax=Noctiluca scintillans TaxID=2966 RepID=A0A7S1AJC2_NOCSC|mmetsp:Transcript_46992/g.124877  ORF Transcript_46992/g.124877 Transcript_46992/m.124877 type:complete len:129 (+) Transcript_46992:363-749(+)
MHHGQGNQVCRRFFFIHGETAGSWHTGVNLHAGACRPGAGRDSLVMCWQLDALAAAVTVDEVQSRFPAFFKNMWPLNLKRTGERICVSAAHDWQAGHGQAGHGWLGLAWPSLTELRVRSAQWSTSTDR